MLYSAILFTVLASCCILATGPQSVGGVSLNECPSLLNTSSSTDEGSGETIETTALALPVITTQLYCIVHPCIVVTFPKFTVLKVIHVTDTYFLAASNTPNVTAIAVAPAAVECPERIYLQIVINIVTFVVRVLVLLITSLATAYLLWLHLTFNELRSLLGKLLVVYNTIVSLALLASLLLIMSSMIFAPNSQPVCQVFIHAYTLTTMAYESCGTVVMAQLYYLTYRDYKGKAPMSSTWTSQLFEHYMMYTFAPMLPMTILTVGFDFTAKVGNETILPSGHCILPPRMIYESVFLAYLFIAVQKIGQIMIFAYSWYYFHKLYFGNGVKGSSELEDHSNIGGDHMNAYEKNKREEKNKQLRRIVLSASIPSATIISVVIWFICILAGSLLAPLLAAGGDFALMLQQITFVVTMMSSKKIMKLCKDWVRARFKR